MTPRQLRARARRKRWHPLMLNGHPDIEPRLYPLVMEGIARGLVVTSTRDGVHAPTSFHYSGRAVDLGVRPGLAGSLLAHSRLVRFQRHLHSVHGRRLTELFGPSNRANRKYGRVLSLHEGNPLEQLHDNHVHIAI